MSSPVSGCGTTVLQSHAVDRFTTVMGADVAGLDATGVKALLAEVIALVGMLHGREVDLHRRLRDLSLTQPGLVPEFVTAEATRRSATAAARVLERADTAAQAPMLKASLDQGSLSAEHVDAFAAAVRSLEPALRPQLLAREADLVRRAVATRMTVEQFRGWLRREIRRFDDGRARLARQQADTRLRVWTDARSGMVQYAGAFDPLSGAVFMQRVADQLDTRFGMPRPDSCPADPFAAQDWLRAHALLDLVRGEVTGAGRPEMIVVIDHSTLVSGFHDRSRVDAGPGIELPHSTLLDIAGRARFVPVVVDTNGVVIAQGHAVPSLDQLAASLTRPVALDHGRDRRHASVHQRRALRAMYPRCAMPGCRQHISTTHAHHLWEWDRGGPTDLHNLLPLCPRHHHLAHQLRWRLTLRPNRALTVVTGGPPGRCPPGRSPSGDSPPGGPAGPGGHVTTLSTGPPCTLWE